MPHRKGKLQFQVFVEVLAIVKTRQCVTGARLIQSFQQLFLVSISQQVAKKRMWPELDVVPFTQYGALNSVSVLKDPVS